MSVMQRRIFSAHRIDLLWFSCDVTNFRFDSFVWGSSHRWTLHSLFKRTAAGWEKCDWKCSVPPRWQTRTSRMWKEAAEYCVCASVKRPGLEIYYRFLALKLLLAHVKSSWKIKIGKIFQFFLRCVQRLSQPEKVIFYLNWNLRAITHKSVNFIVQPNANSGKCRNLIFAEIIWKSLKLNRKK